MTWNREEYIAHMTFQDVAAKCSPGCSARWARRRSAAPSCAWHSERRLTEVWIDEYTGAFSAHNEL